MQHCFAYGSLMCPDIMQGVCNQQLISCTSRLQGYRRYKVKGEEYPGLRSCQASSVSGKLYFDLNDEAWRRLDAFEGEYYVREEVEVETKQYGWITAGVYIFKPQYFSLLDEQEWSFEEFIKGGKARFENEYKGYEEL